MLNPFKTIILVQDTYLALVFAISLSTRTSKCNLFATMVLYKRFDVKLICSLCGKIWLSFLCFLITDEINGSFFNRPRPSNGNDGFIFLKIKKMVIPSFCVCFEPKVIMLVSFERYYNPECKT